MNQLSTPTKHISEKELHTALSSLKNNTAADVLKLNSEHFRLGRGILGVYLLQLLNFMTKERHVSPVLKKGLLSPIFKRGDKSNHSNDWGITVTTVKLKILEHVLNESRTLFS